MVEKEGEKVIRWECLRISGKFVCIEQTSRILRRKGSSREGMIEESRLKKKKKEKVFKISEGSGENN